MVQLCSSLRACGLALLGASSLLGTSAIAQQASREPTLAAIKTDSAVKVPPASNDPAADGANEFTPSWETQKTARTYLLSIEDDAEGHSPESRAWFARIRHEEEEAMRRDGRI